MGKYCIKLYSKYGLRTARKKTCLYHSQSLLPASGFLFHRRRTSSAPSHNHLSCHLKGHLHLCCALSAAQHLGFEFHQSLIMGTRLLQWSGFVLRPPKQTISTLASCSPIPYHCLSSHLYVFLHYLQG